MVEHRVRLLIRAHPEAERGEIRLGARKRPVRLERLFESIERPRAVGLSATASPAWHIAAVPDDDASPWDICHRLTSDGLGFAGQSAVAFAEPDLEQKWVWASAERQTLGISGGCTTAEPQDGDVYAVGPGKFWFRGEDHSQLDKARAGAGAPGDGDRVRVAHIDTGFDPDHTTLPAFMRLDLQRNFVDDDRPDDATDRPTAVVNPMFGHGTGTLGLLAGRNFDGAPLGGAPGIEVVPIRVANWVVLFSNSAIARAFDYVHRLSSNPRTRIHVVTMSLGGTASAAWADAVNALYDMGVFVVTAAGNNYGNLPTRNIVYPARFDRVVAACGVMADGRPYADLPIRKMAGCYGPKRKRATSIAAFTPNVPWAKFGCREMVDWDGGGTSAATPQVAAAAALWIQKNRAAYDAYPAGWMRVEAVRKALFDGAAGEDPEHFGRGILRASDALAVTPATAAKLERHDEDSASFAVLRLLTGLGIDGEGATRQRMLELEALQLSQSSREIETMLADRDPGDPDVVRTGDARRILEALAEHPDASNALRGEIAARLRDSGAPLSPRAAVPAPDTTGRLHPGAIEPAIPSPPARRLLVYAFDPLLGTRLETLHLNKATVKVRWEDKLRPGPVGEYLEVVDVDPPSGRAYAPVDLDRRELLAQDGLEPTEGNPQFHQQMVYAVAMKTIEHFEKALGRVALWAERRGTIDGKFDSRFVRRLRVYPHGLRERNAFYSPDRKALLFGYFNASATEAGDNLPGGLVFSCLSHDIVAHETTHALLDGLHPRFKEPTNVDMLAFHEAFADIVALFQHFTLPEALRDQIARARGDLAVADLLGGLARQFGQAIGLHGALRSAIGTFAEDGTWVPHKPDRGEYRAHTQPHRLGAVLVGAVFDAFLQIYRYRTGDLIRLATGGSGLLPEGEISRDLVERLAQEASRIAGQVLGICIRALDYCPPVDLTFGEYLRALITADRDLVPDDEHGYRVAFINAFRARGIYPREVGNLSVDALAWQKPDIDLGGLNEIFEVLALKWKLNSDRYEAYVSSNEIAKRLHGKLVSAAVDEHAFAALGLVKTTEPVSVTIDGTVGQVSSIEMHSIRPAQRVSPDGVVRTNVVIEMTQKWTPSDGNLETFRGGCTIICDHESGEVRYVVRKRIGSRSRIDAQRAFTQGFARDSVHASYFGMDRGEPFALLHRHD